MISNVKENYKGNLVCATVSDAVLQETEVEQRYKIPGAVFLSCANCDEISQEFGVMCKRRNLPCAVSVSKVVVSNSED